MTIDYESRHMIEALRSGIPSRDVGRCFSDARGDLTSRIIQDIQQVRDEGISLGSVVSGKYGEGKTHLLNTIFSLAHAQNMVVSFVSLSKETPFDKLYQVYKKIVNSTYLPNRMQPGFVQEFDKLTPNNQISQELMLLAAKQLETDRLYYVLRSFLNTDDQDEQYLLQTDLEGDMIPNFQIKKIYRRLFQEKVNFSVNFVKSKHCLDYFSFLSQLFVCLGYNGWVLLFDETELIGRLGKKTRMKAYANMHEFLFPKKQMNRMYSLFAISSSYAEDVVEGKHEYEHLKELYDEESAKPIHVTLDTIMTADQLPPLDRTEVERILTQLVILHGKAYGWDPPVAHEEVIRVASSAGHLLRTKIRSAIEYLDQVYQYGDAGESEVRDINEGSLVGSAEEEFCFDDLPES